MRQLEWKDARGRQYLVQLPDGFPDSEASVGIPIGPPDVVDALGLPEPWATRLHNALFARAIWSARIASRSPQLLQSAVMAAFRIDAQVLYQAFVDLDRDPPAEGG